MPDISGDHPGYYYGSIPVTDLHVFLQGQPQMKRGLGSLIHVLHNNHINVSSYVNGAAEPRSEDATRKARGVLSGTNNHNNQPVRQRNNTHIWAEGVSGSSKGSRRGTRKTTTRMTTTTTTSARRRSAPRGPMSPYPRRRRQRSPGIFLYSKEKQGWIWIPGGEQEEGGGGGGNK